MLMRSPPDRLLPSLESCLVLVREGLVKVAGGENPEADLRHLRAVLLNLLDLIEGDSAAAAAVDEVFEAALAYQGEFAHAAKAHSDSAYHFLLRDADRMERALAELRTALQHTKPSARCLREAQDFERQSAPK